MSEEYPLEAMTINERLFALGLASEFDAAVVARDVEAACQILVRAKLSPAQASESVTAILENPSKYGFR